MKKLSVSALALVAALCAASAAHADTTPGWYVGAGAGASLPQDPSVRDSRGKFNARDEDVNLDLLGNAGYAWHNGLRVEGEYFHNQNNTNHFDDVAGAGSQGSGHITNNAIFGNVLYDLNAEQFGMGKSRFTPYIGAGIGPDFINVKSVGSSSVGYLKGDTLDAAYQGIVGASTQLDANWAVTADYRYIASFDPKVDSTTGGQGRMDNASHNIVLGVRYSFNCPAPMAKTTAPMVGAHGATHATGVASSDFTVFFDFNKATITPEAHRIIAAAAAEFKKSGNAVITVTGHTDTVGSDGYNQKLSDKRANAVEVELKKLGVSTKSITETGVGKSDLLVPTADGVREAQNRRAEIVLGSK